MIDADITYLFPLNPEDLETIVDSIKASTTLEGIYILKRQLINCFKASRQTHCATDSSFYYENFNDYLKQLENGNN